MRIPSKRFMDRLCNFILREQGRGFAMEVWDCHPSAGKVLTFDDIERKVPKCGTVCCIGGSIDMLLSKGKELSMSTGETGAAIGLDYRDAKDLFYGWNLDESGGWPQTYKLRYVKAKTASGKARVAVSMLKLAVKTHGACFHPGKKLWNLTKSTKRSQKDSCSASARR